MCLLFVGLWLLCLLVCFCFNLVFVLFCLFVIRFDGLWYCKLTCGGVYFVRFCCLVVFVIYLILLYLCFLLICLVFYLLLLVFLFVWVVCLF